MSLRLAKAIAESTLKFPQGQPEPTFFHCAVDDCGYKRYGEIAQKYRAKEVRDLAKPNVLKMLLALTIAMMFQIVLVLQMKEQRRLFVYCDLTQEF